MSHPPIPPQPARAPTYSLGQILLVSAGLVGSLALVVVLLEFPVVGALLAAGAMTTRLLVREVTDAKAKFPSDGERLCYCIPGTNRCIHI